MFSPILRRLPLAALSAAALLLSAACSSRTTTPPPLAALDSAGNQQALVALDHEIAAAGTDAAALAPIATRLVQTLRDPAATAAARQAISERLPVFPAGVLTAGENAALFGAMLTDDRQVNLARLALDRVPGEAVDALYLRALAAANGAARLALVQSIGNRRIASAVPALAQQLDSSDALTAAAAVKALGQIGTVNALAALRTAPNTGAAEVIAARLAAAERLGGPTASRELETIAAMLGAPAHLRAAATRSLLFATPQAAADRFVAVLEGNDAVLKPVVIEAIGAHPSPQLVPALAARLAAWDAPTQAAVIAVLGRKAEAAAVPAVAVATRHGDAEVRAAAITALGELPGSPATAALLAEIAAGDNADEAKLAQQSLARLTGPAVAETVLTGAAQGEFRLREVYIDQLASRYMVEALPLLLKTRADPDARIRAAALGALADIAPASEQRAILDWTLAASAPGEQSRALRALAEVTLRNPDVANRSLPIIEAIEQAPTAVAVRLAPVLPRIGGDPSVAATARLALRNEPALAAAAVTSLGRWNNRASLVPLVEVAEKAPLDQTRGAAGQNALRFLTRMREIPHPELVALVARLLETTRDQPTRARLAYLLTRCSEPEALALAERLATDPALAADAGDAVLAIKANRAGPPTLSATLAEEALENVLDNKPRTQWVVPAALGQSLTLDFHSTRPVRQLVLDGGGAKWGSPDMVEVFVTDDVKNPGPARVTAPGQLGKTVIDLPTGVRGRYLVIRHATEKSDEPWMIAELVVE